MPPVPGHILRWLDGHGYRPMAEVHGGGSDAALVLAKTSSGGASIVKWARTSWGQVDGHGSDALVRKARQHIWLRRNADWFANTYPRLLLVRDAAGAFTVTDYIEAANLEDQIISGATGKDRNSESPVNFCINRYITIIESGLAAGVGHFHSQNWPEIDSLTRVKRRLMFISKVSEEISTSIASQWRSLDRTISSLPGSPLSRLADLVSLNEPVRGFPLHGDLNLSNVLLSNSDTPRNYLIDPAGIHRWRDPLYDVAKALFHLALIIPIKISLSTEALRDTGEVFQRLAVELLQVASTRNELAARSAVRRLIGYYASHILAEAACRVSLAVQGHDLANNLVYARTYLAAGQTALRGVFDIGDPAKVALSAATDGVLLPSIASAMSARV